MGMGEKDHFIALDSLRGLCASIIVLVHIEGDAFVTRIPFVRNGGLFVDFFFVLSGFVIASSYGEKLRGGFPISRFMLLRLGRLYPLHLFVLFLFAVVALAKTFGPSGSNFTIASFVDAGLLLQAWTPYVWPEANPWNPPSWSISAEIWMYFLFAIMCKITKGNFVFFVLIAISLAILAFDGNVYLTARFSGLGFVRCMLGFLCGVFVFRLLKASTLKEVSDQTFSFLELLVSSASLLMVSFAATGPQSLLCVPVFSFTVFVFAHQRGAISSVLLAGPFVLIGTLSYSIYMTHEFVLARSYNVISMLPRYLALPIKLTSDQFGMLNTSGWNFASDVGVLCIYVSVLLVSYATFNLIERPCRIWSRKSASIPGLKRAVS